MKNEVEIEFLLVFLDQWLKIAFFKQEASMYSSLLPRANQKSRFWYMALSFLEFLLNDSMG